jgi:hypothetical protein
MTAVHSSSIAGLAVCKSTSSKQCPWLGCDGILAHMDVFATLAAAAGVATAGQLPAQMQQAPEPTLQLPLLEVTEQGAATLVSVTASLQLHVSSPHTAIVWVAAHTQHAPAPVEQLPVDALTVHGPYCLVTSLAIPQSHVDPHRAIVSICDMRLCPLICSDGASPDRDSGARAKRVNVSTRQAIKCGFACITGFLQMMGKTPLKC